MNLTKFLPVCLSLIGLSHPAATQTQPNVLLILADDMGWGDVNANGNKLIDTPVLNRLAKQSMNFDRFYVCPLCAPTRSEILTGRYFLRTGVSSVAQGFENMRSNESTIAEILQSNGYATGCFGKWHNGAYFEQHPNRQGFDEFVGFCVGHLGYYFDAVYEHNDQEIKSTGYSTDFFTSQAIQFMEANHDKPFFCYVPYNVPHSPFQVPENYFLKYKAKGLSNELATIHGMVENMDENIGRLLAKLDELKLRENTLVIFLSDNGPNTYRYNGGMKGKKGSVDEGGVRVPFYISWPGKIQSGITRQLAQDIDILPTVLGLCGISYHTAFPVDGKNLSGVIFNQEKPADRYIFSRQANENLSICKGSVRNDSFRLVVARGDTALFNLNDDPGQEFDLAVSNPVITRQLAKAYLDWEQDLVKNYQSETEIVAGFLNEKRIVLPVQDASLSGEVKFSSIYPNQAHTENWVQQGDSICWSLRMVDSGNYRIDMQYACPLADIGSTFQFRINQVEIPFSIQTPFDSMVLPDRDYVPRGESVERTWAWMELGTSRIEAGSLILGIKLQKKTNQKAGLIKAIRLVKL